MCVKYSIIVPVYNSEKYLRQCLDSLVGQTYKDFEVIVWNDGSTDDSANILKEYSSHPNFKIFNEKNSGVTVARKRAFEVSSGQYILYLDSDDVFSLDCLETIDQYLDSDIDLLQFGSVVSSFDGAFFKNVDFVKKTVFSKNEFYNNTVLDTIIKGGEAVVVWNKVYRRELIAKYVTHADLCPLEDYVFNMDYYSVVNKFCIIDAVLHHYRSVDNSLSRTIHPNWFETLLNVQRRKEKFMKTISMSNNENDYYSSVWFFNYAINIFSRMILFKFHADELIIDFLNNSTTQRLAQKLVFSKNKHAKLFKCVVNTDIDAFLKLLKRKVVIIKLKKLLKSIILGMKRWIKR